MTIFNIGSIQVNERLTNDLGILDIKLSIPYVNHLNRKQWVIIYVYEQGINLDATGTLNKAGQQALQDGLRLANLLQKYSKVEYVCDSFPPLQPEPDIEIDADDEVNLLL